MIADLELEFRGRLPIGELVRLANEEVSARRWAPVPELVPVLARRNARKRARQMLSSSRVVRRAGSEPAT